MSGGSEMAAADKLLVIAGGDKVAFETARPVFETYGNPVVHIGELGSGQLAKLVNNALFVADVALGYDAMRIGEAIRTGKGSAEDGHPARQRVQLRIYPDICARH